LEFTLDPSCTRRKHWNIVGDSLQEGSETGWLIILYYNYCQPDGKTMKLPIKTDGLDILAMAGLLLKGMVEKLQNMSGMWICPKVRITYHLILCSHSYAHLISLFQCPASRNPLTPGVDVSLLRLCLQSKALQLQLLGNAATNADDVLDVSFLLVYVIHRLLIIRNLSGCKIMRETQLRVDIKR
jgi:hypothetical protein